MKAQFDIDTLDFSKATPNGLIPAVAQDVRSGKILMLAFVNQEAVEQSLVTGFAHFFSRSRDKIWKKGEESGNTLKITGIATDCDSDAVVYFVEPTGPTCHTGEDSCFFRGDPAASDPEWTAQLEKTIASRARDLPENSYISSLFQSGSDRIIQKVGEEAIETVIAAKNSDEQDFLSEAADLYFHFLVLLTAKGHTLSDIISILRKRQK